MILLDSVLTLDSLVIVLLSWVTYVAIVLAKMLLFGENVERDLYDYRIEGITKDLQCDLAHYRQLIDLCTHPSVTTAQVFVFVRSILAYFQVSDKRHKDAP